MEHRGHGIPKMTESEKILMQTSESDYAAMGDALHRGSAIPEDVEGALDRLMGLDTASRYGTPEVFADLL
jgi:hypothetical protein